MKLIILLLISSVCFGQAKDSSSKKPKIPQSNIEIPALTDSTAILSLKDIDVIKKYLGDKLIGKDYELVVNALYELFNARAKEFQKPKQK